MSILPVKLSETMKQVMGSVGKAVGAGVSPGVRRKNAEMKLKVYCTRH